MKINIHAVVIIVILILIGVPLVKLARNVKPMTEVAVNAGLEKLDTTQYLKLPGKFKIVGKGKNLGKYKSIEGRRFDGESFMVIMPNDYDCKEGDEIEIKIMWPNGTKDGASFYWVIPANTKLSDPRTLVIE